jgi:adenosylcobyric acid synthase
VLGICGGYQMMGREVCDPDHVEGDQPRLPGLGLLPVSTTIGGSKLTRQVSGVCQGQRLSGYEIHMGTTTVLQSAEPLLHLDDGSDDGCRADDRCMGTYLHGILDNAAFVDMLLSPYAHRLRQDEVFDYASYKQQQYDLLAQHVRRHVDVDAVYRMLE